MLTSATGERLPHVDRLRMRLQHERVKFNLYSCLQEAGSG